VSDFTQLLEAIDHDDARVADKLLPLVYEQLRRTSAGRYAFEIFLQSVVWRSRLDPEKAEMVRARGLRPHKTALL